MSIQWTPYKHHKDLPSTILGEISTISGLIERDPKTNFYIQGTNALQIPYPLTHKNVLFELHTVCFRTLFTVPSSDILQSNYIYLTDTDGYDLFYHTVIKHIPTAITCYITDKVDGDIRIDPDQVIFTESVNTTTKIVVDKAYYTKTQIQVGDIIESDNRYYTVTGIYNLISYTSSTTGTTFYTPCTVIETRAWETDIHRKYPPHKSYKLYGIYRVSNGLLFYKLSDDPNSIPFPIHSKFLLTQGMIENYTASDPIQTTYGLYLCNRVVLSDVFGDKIPYINSSPGKAEFTLSKIDSIVAKMLLDGTIGRKEYDLYMQHGYFLGHLPQLIVPGLTEKALGTDPKVHETKKALLNKYRNKLHDPTVLVEIEKQLIAMDREWIRGDASERYYAISEKKSFNEYRKKMFLTMGISPSFSKNSATYEFIEKSLAEGWTIEDLPKIANEIRRGSYDRGLSTAKGGEQSKFIVRVFNASRIIENDCQTDKGLPTVLTPEYYKEYLYRYIIDGSRLILLDEDTIKKYIGKTVQLRSPMYCKTKGGLCSVCTGEIYRKLKQDNLGMLAMMIGSTFLSINMKSMHFSGIKSEKIGSLENYLVPSRSTTVRR